MRRIIRRLAGLAGLLALPLSLATPARAQLTFPGASPVSSGNFIIRAQPLFTQGTGGFSSFSDKSVLIYGASPDIAVIVQNTTFAANTVRLGTGAAARSETASGFGDTVLEGRYTVYQHDGIGSTLRVAPYVGLVMPTGMDNANAEMSRAAQPGSGTWGTRDAVTMSVQTLTWNGGAEAGYQANAPGAGYRFGNTFYADIGAHYLLWPSSLEGDVPAELYGSLEANFTSTAPNHAGGAKVPGSGAQLLLIDPGIIYTRSRYSVSFTGFLPAWEHAATNASRYVYGAEVLLRLSLFTEYHL